MPYMVDHDGIAMGPYSLEDIEKKIALDVLAPTDLICDENGGRWLPVSKVLAGHTGELAVITSGKIDASTIFNSVKRVLLGSFRK